MSRDTQWDWVTVVVPGAFFALLVNLRRFISLPDLFPLAPANSPRVSEDGKTCSRGQSGSFIVQLF